MYVGHGISYVSQLTDKNFKTVITISNDMEKDRMGKQMHYVSRDLQIITE